MSGGLLDGNLGRVLFRWYFLDGAWHRPKIVNGLIVVHEKVVVSPHHTYLRKNHPFSLFISTYLYRHLLNFVTNLKQFMTIEGFCHILEKNR